MILLQPHFLPYWDLRKTKTQETMFAQSQGATWVQRHAAFLRSVHFFTVLFYSMKSNLVALLLIRTLCTKPVAAKHVTRLLPP